MYALSWSVPRAGINLFFMLELLSVYTDWIYLGVLICLLGAIFYDLRFRLIPNWLIGLVLTFGFLNLSFHPELALQYLISLGIGVLVWGGLFYARLMGGGDAKLMMALSLLVLPMNLFVFYLCVLAIGAIQALTWLVAFKDKTLPYALAIGLGSVVFYLLNNLTPSFF